MIKKILNIAIILLFIGWISIIIIDYKKVQNDQKAIFCLEIIIYEYEDGSVEECQGLGYKVYYYDRTSLNVKTDFVTFWMKIRK